MTHPDTRPQFEDACWAHYQGLKARGWSHPEEGDPNCRESLFWREESGQYGVRSVEAAWRGWQMREAAEANLLREAKVEIEWWIDEHPCCRGHEEDLLERIDAHLLSQNV